MQLSKYSNNFHLIRHLAACMVVYAHCIVPGDGEFFNIITHGRLEISSLGVEIFFILSGYLVTQSLLATPTRWQFARKRWLRLWPALFAVTCVMVFVLGPIVTILPVSQYFKNPQTWYFLLRNSLLLPIYTLPGVFVGDAVNTTFWTVFFELLCYIALLLIGKAFLQKNRTLILASWVAVAIFKYFVPSFLHIPSLLHPYIYGIEDMMFLFFSGSAWLLFTQNKAALGAKIYLPAVAVFISSIAFAMPFSLFFKAISLVVLVIELGRTKPVFKWPSWDVSYGIYLIGWPVQMVLVHQFQGLATSSAKLVFATLAVTLPIAFASWYIIERPALQKK